jgi:hypothetical protein
VKRGVGRWALGVRALPLSRHSSPAQKLPNAQSPTPNHVRTAIVLLAILAFTPAAFACPVCFGAPDDPMVKGVNNGIWVLLGLVAVVQVGFAAMFWSFWRRAREQKRFRESLRVIHRYDREGPLS